VAVADTVMVLQVWLGASVAADSSRRCCRVEIHVD
jgi:hypothetical protein